MQQATPQELNFFEKKARDWAFEVVELYKTPAVGVELIEKNRLLKSAKKIKDSVEFITGQIDVFKPIDTVQLSALPALIAAGAIAAASAAIYKWNTDYKIFKKKLAERVRLEKSGLDPVQAANLTASLDTKKTGLITLALDHKKIIIPAVLLIGGYYLFKKVRK